MRSVSYPRRQLEHRLVRVAELGLSALTVLVLALVALSARLTTLAVVLALVSTACATRARHWWRLARRSGIGAHSEQQVRTQLDRLAQDGWRIRHSLCWPGGGDIDHLASAPGPIGLTFVIETKTRTYRPGDLARISAVARWQAQRQSARHREDAIPILCLAGTRGIERWENGVAVVSLDRLVAVMSRLARTTRKPAFLQ
jgi:Nuclease-related domain